MSKEESQWGKRPSIADFQVLFDECCAFAATGESDPITIVNELPGKTEDERDARKDILFNIYEEETLDIIPRCQCPSDPGILPGEFNLGVRCPKCGFKVKADYTTELSTQRWLRVPEGVDYFINPQIWAVLNEILGSSNSSGFSVLKWLTDTRYRFNSGNKINKKLAFLESLGVKRGYNHFCNNFIEVMEAVMVPKLTRGTRQVINETWEFLRRFEDRIFCVYIPLPDKTLFTMEQEPNKIKVDKTLVPFLEGLMNILNVESDEYAKPVEVENATANGIHNFSEYFNAFGCEMVDPKPGITRKQTIGTREPFSARGIVISNWDVHDYSKIIPSWQIAIGLFRLHLINKMTKEKIPLRKQYDLLHTYTNRANRDIYRMLREILNVHSDEGEIGYPCEFNRNPTLDRLSGQYLEIVDVSKDPDIKAILFSVLALAGANTDFDGCIILPSLNFSNCWNAVKLI